MKDKKLGWTGMMLLFLLCFSASSSLQADDLSITVYNQDIALVRDVRTVALESGLQEYIFDGVAAKIDPTSVHLKADQVTVLEQNFEYDLVDRKALAQRYLGEQVHLILSRGEVDGTLLSVDDGIILRDEDGTVQYLNPEVVEGIRFPELPEGLVIRPALRWILRSEKKGDVDTELSYLTHGIGWEASYVGVVSEAEDAMDFAGWVQIDNRSGASYDNALLKLVAGDVQIEKDRRFQHPETVYTLDAAAGKRGGFEEKSFYEYHLYTLPRKVSIADKQNKQITLIPSVITSVSKEYTYDHRKDAKKVDVTLEFRNDEEHSLGIPLPHGKVRLYKKDSDGSLIFIGEDRIDHTPKDEKVRLTTGQAFDITVERTQVNYKSLGKKAWEASFKLEISNAKEEPVEVVVVEQFWGDWKITDESISGEKTSATSNEWRVPVPGEGKETLQFQVKVKRY